MSTSRHFDKICLAVIAVSLVITVIFMNGTSLGIAAVKKLMGYESRLFDTSRVHNIDIVCDDWDGFIKDCENEEYIPCAVVIDGESFKNTGIRAKGNTSLSSVKRMGSSRYSFKLEFDRYEDGKSYHGLDKICLNNLIQDNTMMKDYTVYTLMKNFGVNAPLCSFVYITVNGEDWGLYLAVEGIEDGFLQRNFGSESGNLYKPDSMDAGGGRGNGKNFEFDKDRFADNAENGTGTTEPENGSKGPDGENGNIPEPPQGFGEMPDGERPEMPQNGSKRADGENGDMPEPPQGFGDMPDGEGPEMPQNGSKQADGENGNMPEPPQGFGDMPDGEGPEMPQNRNKRADGENGNMPEPPQGFGEKFGGNKPGGRGSDDVKLKYIDDSTDSYKNIFDNAKTKVSSSDKKRLIASLKDLSEYKNLENVLDTEAVLRYFTVHNFVCNGDSYTGSMVHNYYLYEKDGRLSMIPWDYNLAFGTFHGGNASQSVNASIDNPVTDGEIDDRPMAGWIFSDSEYTDRYHELFSSFINEQVGGGRLEELITATAEMIKPYVEKDPTKFCTTEEFEKGVTALKSFVSLRCESILKQLGGDSTKVDTASLNISDMGTMNVR